MDAELFKSHEHILLEKLLGQPLSSSDAAAVEACEECRRRAVDLAPVVDSLLAQGERERSAIREELERAEPPHFEDASIQRFVEDMQRSATTRAPLGRRLMIGLAAAAAILLVVVRVHREGEPEPFFLGTGGLDLEMSPSFDVRTLESFTWKHVAPDGSYTLEVRSLDRLDEEPLVRITEILTPSWQPNAETREALRKGIRWEVHVYDELNRLIGSGWVETRASP